MADNSVKFLTGSISDLQAKNTNGTPKVPIVPGRVYFAVDTERNYGYIAYDVSASQRLVMSTRAELSDRVSHDLTLGDKSYNGSADVDILGSDLHRLSASNYLGITNTNITTSPGITTASVYIIAEKKNKTAVVGNLVIYNNKEYYWSGGAGWKPVGTASFKLRQNPISSPSASSSTISFIDTISQDENGIITATKKTVRNATASQSGVVTTTEQTFGGLKIFNNGIKLGSNINMGDAGTPSSYPFVGNKITWTGGTDGAEIYYRLDSSDAGRLFLNMTDDTNALIALAYNGTAKSYINPSTPSFYPATSNTGSLGTSSNKWANIYATTIHGNLDGNASTATNATTATNLSAAGTWTWANGTTAGPTATLVLGGKTTNVGAIPSASTSQSGIITTGAQSFAGVKTFTNKIVLKDGNQAGAQIGAAYITTASATNGEVVLQNGHLRFGGSDWDYNQWAGLKYDHINKKIVLGLADGSEFTANSAQSGGTFKLAGISTVDLNKTASIRNLAVGGGIYWNPYVESSSDGSDAASITVLSSGAAGGTELRIQQANDSTDIINLVSPSYIYFNSKQAFQINDSWLRINPNGGFSSGTLFSRLLRADAELQARDIGLYNANQFRTGRWYNVATGTAGDGSNSGTMGAVYLELGNGTAQSAASGAGGGNAKGYLRLYGSSTAVGTLEFDNTYFRPSADIYFVNNSSSTSGWANGIRGQVGANDYWRVGGGATGSNSGYMEIATADDANEPIYVRQYSGVFGTLNTTLTLLDASHNTIIPNALTVGTTTSQAANYKFYVNGTSYFNGNTTHNGIDYFANGTTYYINNSADANLRRGIFSGTSNGDTAASSFFNTGALEIREAGRVGNGQTSFNYAPRIGFHWSGRIAGSLSFHNDGIFYFRKQNGTDRATIDANVNGNSSTATQFASNKSITLSGDVSGSASSKGGWSITTSIGAGKVTNAMLAGSIENGKLVNSKITLAGNDVSLGGSLSADTLRTSLGLSNALHFIGIATVAITDGSTTDPKISGYTTKTSGDVIIDKDSAYEYIWTGSKWERLGGDGSYKVVQSAVVDPTASGTSNTFIATISQDANGKITATKKTVAVTNNAPTLAWGTTSTIGTVAGTSLQVKMPANPNVDTKVTQNAIKASDYTNWRPLIWGASNSSTEGFTPSTVTDGVYTAQTLSCQPSSGTIKANTFKGNLSGNAATVTIPLGFSARGTNNWTNGDFTADGYTTYVTDWDEPSGGSIYWASNNKGQLSAAIDGYFYQGRDVRDSKLHRCLDTYDLANGTFANADKLDGYHENSFLRYRDTVSGSGGTSHSNSLWSQIGIRQYNNALPDAMADNATYTYGAVISLPGADSRLDIWYNHQTSSNGNGLRYRTGWDNDKKAWSTILDNNNYTSYTVTKTGSGATGTWGINITGNAATATKFASAQSITLTGDTTGTASSQAGWSISTTTSKLSNTGHLDTVEKLDGFIEANKLKYATVASIGGVASDGMIISAAWSSSSWGHQVFLDDSAMVMQHRHRYTFTADDGTKTQKWSGWATLLDSNNYTNYTVTKTGSGASGTWGINITGNAAGLSAIIANDKLPDRLREYHTNGMILDSTACGWYYASSSNTSPFTTASDFMVMNQGYSTDWGSQIATDFRSNRLAVRNKNNGTWNSWVRVLDQNTGVARAHYGTTSGSEKYVLITINKETHWMLNFTIKLYQSYTATDIQVSGYNYGSNYWYSPNAVILGSTNTNGIKVYFGYTGAYKLWVAVDGGDYTGVDVLNAVNGYQQISLDDAFTITRVSALPGTLQTTITAYRPYYRNETVTTATKLATARTISLTGSVTGSGTFDGSGNLSIATTTNHSHNYIKDIGNATNTTFAYSKAGLNYNEYTWLAAWNGYELRAVNKSQFAQASHNHDNNYVKKSGDTMTGNLILSSNFLWIQGGSAAGSNTNRLTTTSGMPGTMQYNQGRRGTQIYSNGIAFADPYNGNTNNDAGWIRHVEETANAGYLEIATGDDSNEGIYVRQYNTSNQIAKSITLMDSSGYSTFIRAYGAVWNDYAEYRQSDITEPGRVVIENGDGTLSLSTKRLQRGAEIISDTFGFAIGETDECKTPIAATGRVLAYTYEPIEEYKSKIGWPVCSGPNGTVSVMSEEEEEKYPSRIIGTISEIPTYEEWGTGKVKVDGRVWIRIK